MGSAKVERNLAGEAESKRNQNIPSCKRARSIHGPSQRDNLNRTPRELESPDIPQASAT
jgi:hypothetical protein